MNEKTKGMPSFSHSIVALSETTIQVDENMFYKGVDKRTVHGARLHQVHSLSEPLIDSGSAENDPSLSETSASKEEHPPYPFESGNSLLALTKKHNVSYFIVDSV